MKKWIKALSENFSLVDVLLIVTAIIWGINPTVVKLSFRELSPFAFNGARYILATITCWILLILKEKDWKVEKQDLLGILGIGFIGNYINQAFFITGVKNTTAGNSSLIMAALPIIVATVNTLFKLEKTNFKMALGIFVSSLGIVAVILGTGNKINLLDQYFYGNVIIFTGTLTWATYTILNKKYLQKYSSLKIATYGITIGMIGMIITWSQSLLSQDWTGLSLPSYLGILYSGVLSISLGTVFWNVGISKAGSTKTSLYSNINPIVSVICGIVILGESFRMLQGLGALLIFAGLYITGRGKKMLVQGERAKT